MPRKLAVQRLPIESSKSFSTIFSMFDNGFLSLIHYLQHTRCLIIGLFRAFQYVCQYLGSKSFFRGHIPRILSSLERFASPYRLFHFNQSPKVFNIFTESLKSFKFFYVVIEPLTSEARVNLCNFEEEVCDSFCEPELPLHSHA